MSLIVVTGALGYSGRSIAEQFLERGDRVRTLTNSPGRPSPISHRLEIRPLNFGDMNGLVEALRGADVLVNTYWVRFNHRLFTFDQAVRNSRSLFEAARRAGVRKIVHTSILKPEAGQGLAYYEGKLALERDLEKLGVEHVILRPGVLFGRGDILVNNIAWALRNMPVFGLFGDGGYKLQPMHVDDFASLALQAAAGRTPAICDAVGPETFRYRDLVELIARSIGVRHRVQQMPPVVAYSLARLLNPLVGDVVITWQEVQGLMRGLLYSDCCPQGTPIARKRLSDWLGEHSGSIGRRYASEVGRRRDRNSAYDQI